MQERNHDEGKNKISRREFLRKVVAGTVTAGAAAVLGGCKPEEPSTPPGITPTKEPTKELIPTPKPIEVSIDPTPTSEPANVEDLAMVEIAEELSLGDNSLFSKRVIEKESPYAGGEIEGPKLKLQELGVRRESREISVGWNLVGSIPMAVALRDEGGEVRGYSLKGLDMAQVEGQTLVEVNREVLSEIMHSGVAQYVDQEGKIIGEVPIYVYPPREFSSDVFPRLALVPGETENEPGQFRIDWIGEYGEVLEQSEPFSVFPGEGLIFDWEQGLYSGQEESGFGLIAPEVEPEPELETMIEVVSKQEVETWWQGQGIKKDGQLVEVKIQEDKYLNDRSNEVKSWKVIDGSGIVWMRVFANVPEKPIGQGRDDLVFAEKIPGKLAVRYQTEEGDSQIISLIVNLTAEEERSGLRPILKTNSLTIVRPFLWKEGNQRAQEAEIDLYYDDVAKLPQSIQGIKGREFNNTLASWLSYVGQEGLSRIVGIWKESARNGIPLDYTDGDPVPLDFRESWGNLPHDLANQALDNLVEAARNSSALDSEKRTFFRDLVGEVRAIEIRGRYGEGTPFLKTLAYDTYNYPSETVYLAFYEDANNNLSTLRIVADLYRRNSDTASKKILCCLLSTVYFHEAEWTRYSVNQFTENLQATRKFFLWLMEVFSSDFNSASSEVKAYITDQYIPYLNQLAQGGVAESLNRVA